MDAEYKCVSPGAAAFERMKTVLHGSDEIMADEIQAGELADMVEQVFSYLANLNTRQLDSERFISAARTLSECERRLDLEIYEDALRYVLIMFNSMLERGYASWSDEMESAVVDALISMSYQKSEFLLYELVTNGYMGFVRIVLDGNWRKVYKEDIYMALFRMTVVSPRLHHAIVETMKTSDILESVRKEPDALHEKCYLVYAYTQDRLSDGEVRDCIKVLHCVFVDGEYRSLDVAASALYNLVNRGSQIHPYFLANNLLKVMTERADNDDRVTELVLYVVEAVARKAGKSISIDVASVVRFIASENEVCHVAMAATVCLCSLIDNCPGLVADLNPSSVLMTIQAKYFDAPLAERKYFNKLIMTLCYKMSGSDVLNIVRNGYVTVIAAMSTQLCDKDLIMVIRFYMSLFGYAEAEGVARDLWNAFSAEGGFDNLKELASAVESAGQKEFAEIYEATESMLYKYADNPPAESNNHAVLIND